MSEDVQRQSMPRKRNPIFVFLPLILFIILAAIFALQLASGRDEFVPSLPHC